MIFLASYPILYSYSCAVNQVIINHYCQHDKTLIFLQNKLFQECKYNYKNNQE